MTHAEVISVVGLVVSITSVVFSLYFNYRDRACLRTTSKFYSGRSHPYIEVTIVTPDADRSSFDCGAVPMRKASGWGSFWEKTKEDCGLANMKDTISRWTRMICCQRRPMVRFYFTIFGSRTHWGDGIQLRTRKLMSTYFGIHDREADDYLPQGGGLT